MPEIVKNLLRGFAMGSADIVPGISGGTVALVVGIYTRLIDSISDGSRALISLVKGDVDGFKSYFGKVEWAFLLPLLAGIGAAVIALSSLLETLLADHPESLAGLFVGLVAASIVIAWGLLERRGVNEVGVVAAVAIVMFVLLGFREITSVHDAATGTPPNLLAFLGAGALAICAMILPGISGSFILVLIGMYGWVLAAVNDRDIVSIGALGFGCVVGLAAFSQLLKWALDKHYNVVMAGLIGLMVGSMRVLWPWPKGVDSTALEAPSGTVVAPIILAIVSFVAVVAFERLATSSASTAKDESEASA